MKRRPIPGRSYKPLRGDACGADIFTIEIAIGLVNVTRRG